ncbi:M20/M25/M40 family metallo-hydrolase [bacterium]|nr:M20/M25/M40 family metallo-hydrolase [bacterium]
MVNTERLKSTILELLSIDSPSRKEGEIAGFLKEKLLSFGFDVWEDSAKDVVQGEVGNILARKDGKGIPIMFNAHMDTIASTRGMKIKIENGVIKQEGASILGGDDKAGIAAILEAIELLNEQNVTHAPLEVIFTICEETSLEGAKVIDTSVLRAKAGFVIDGGEPQVAIISAPSKEQVTFFVRGKSAHAGVHPEQGINAIQLAAKAIANMKLGRIDEETTANIGVIKGGKARNIVPDYVEILGEARSRSEGKLRQQVEHMISCFEEVKKGGGDFIYRVQREYNMFKLTSEALPTRLLLAAGNKLGITISLLDGGGGSDANVFNEKGIPSLIMGAGDHMPHSPEEMINLRELELSALLLYLIAVEASSRVG